jgi:uncharacterized membrane protein
MDSGAGCSMTSSNRRRWRVALPIGNLLLAVCLLLLGHYQRRDVSQERSETGEWTPTHEVHLAPGTQVAYAINFPALMVARPLKMVGQASVVGGFLFALVILWYVVGRILDSGASRPTDKSMAIAALSTIGVLASVVGIWFAWRAVGMHYLIPPLGALVWSVALGAYCVRALRNAVLARG